MVGRLFAVSPRVVALRSVRLGAALLLASAVGVSGFTGVASAVSGDPDSPVASAVSIDFLPAHAAQALSDYDNPGALVGGFVSISCAIDQTGCPPGFAGETTYLVVTRGGQVIAQTNPYGSDPTQAAVPDIELGDTVTVYAYDGSGFQVAGSGVYEPPPTFTSGNCLTHVFTGNAGTGTSYLAVDFADGNKATYASISGGTYTLSDPNLHGLQGYYMTGIRYQSGPYGLVQIREWQPTVKPSILCLGTPWPPALRPDTLVLRKHAKAGTINILRNDRAPNGAHLTLTRVTKPHHGKITCSKTGLCVYKPGKSFKRSDRVRYTASDGPGGTAAEWLTIRRAR